MSVRGTALRALALVALASTAMVSSPASASDREIVVQGSRSAYVDIEVRDDVFLNDLRFSIESRGRYTAMIIEPAVRSAETVGQATLIAYRAAGLGETVTSADKGWIEPGTYRVWLVTDAPAKVRVPVSSGGFVVRPTRRVRARLSTQSSDVVVTGLSAVEHSYDRGLPARWRALVGFHVTGQRFEGDYICATETEECPRVLGVLPPLPSTDERTRAAYVWPMKAERRLLVGVEGFRNGAGKLTSAALVFAEG